MQGKNPFFPGKYENFFGPLLPAKNAPFDASGPLSSNALKTRKIQLPRLFCTQ